MRYPLVFAVYGVLVLPCALASPDVNLKRNAELRDRIGNGEATSTVFADFKNIFRKQYTGKLEEDMRMQIFGENVEFIVRHNVKYANGEVTYKLGINKFTDLTHDEFRHWQRASRLPSNWFNNKLNNSHIATRQKRQTRIHLDAELASAMFQKFLDKPQEAAVYIQYKKIRDNRRQLWRSIPFTPTPNFEVPENLDWRTKNYVTSVKNQGGICGACWAFSSTRFHLDAELASAMFRKFLDKRQEAAVCIVGAIEGQVAKITNKLVTLSVQQLVDCVKKNGCSGGWMTEAFKYIRDVSKGLASNESYPYTESNGTCRNHTHVAGTGIRNYGVTTMNDEEELKQAVAEIGPISIAIDAEPDEYRDYETGVMAPTTCTSYSGHGVLIVGYGVENGNDYWLIKNSWGEGWGEEGYLKLARNNNNMCGVAKMASYPVLFNDPRFTSSNGAENGPQLGCIGLVLGLVVTLIFILVWVKYHKSFKRCVARCVRLWCACVYFFNLLVFSLVIRE